MDSVRAVLTVQATSAVGKPKPRLPTRRSYNIAGQLESTVDMEAPR